MRRRDVLIVAHQYLPSDPRVGKSVEALCQAGLAVDVICLRAPGQPFRGHMGSARLFRMPVRRHRGGGLPVYLLEYLAFFALATVAASALFLRRRYPVVITHTLPDPLVFSAVLPRLLGARVLIDLHEFTPELFQTRYGLAPRHPLIRLTRWLERVSCAFASGVITVHDLGPEILAARGVDAARAMVVMNTADMERWAALAAEGAGAAEAAEAGVPDLPGAGERPFTLVYHGTLVNQYDLLTAVDAVALLRDAPGRPVVLRVVGEGPGLEALEARVRERGLEDRFRRDEPVPIDEIPAILAASDAGLSLMHDVPYADVALPMKILEGLAVGLPVLSTPGAVVRHYFGEHELAYVPYGDADALAAAVLRLRDDPEYGQALASAGREAIRPIRGEVMAARLAELASPPDGP